MGRYLTLSAGGRRELKWERLNRREHVYVHVSGLWDYEFEYMLKGLY